MRVLLSLPPGLNSFSHLRLVLFTSRSDSPSEQRSMPITQDSWLTLVQCLADFGDTLEVVEVIITSDFTYQLDRLRISSTPDSGCHPLVSAFFQRSADELGFPPNHRYTVNVGFSDGSKL